jgi:hypothetical protein
MVKDVLEITDDYFSTQPMKILERRFSLHTAMP